MYPGYEQYWTAVQTAPDQPTPAAGRVPTPGEVEYARFAAHTPHYVLSSTLISALWPKTSFLRGLEEVAALKQLPGKDIYLVGGARTTASLIDAGLVDELRLIVHPLMPVTGSHCSRPRGVAVGWSYGTHSRARMAASASSTGSAEAARRSQEQLAVKPVPARACSAVRQPPTLRPRGRTRTARSSPGRAR